VQPVAQQVPGEHPLHLEAFAKRKVAVTAYGSIAS
jgi:hypothetical protein